MFGYVKPYIPSLTVAQYEAYKGAYCGLCRTMGKITGQSSRLTLSYDFAFLAIFRMAIERIPAKFEKKACAAHPFSKRRFIVTNPALEYCTAACAVLTAGKIKDNINDEKGLKKQVSKLILPFGNSHVKKVRDTVGELEKSVFVHLGKLSEAEKGKSLSLDSYAAIFGDLLADIASFGIEGDISLVAREIGKSVGKIIYVLDAADDLADDIKSEKFNPISLIYNEPLDTNDKEKPILRKALADELYTAVGIEANRAAASFELIEDGGIGIYKGIIMNVLTLGIRSEAERVFYGRGASDNPVKFNI